MPSPLEQSSDSSPDACPHPSFRRVSATVVSEATTSPHGCAYYSDTREYLGAEKLSTIVSDCVFASSGAQLEIVEHVSRRNEREIRRLR